MNTKQQTPAAHAVSTMVLIACLIELFVMPGTASAQTQAVTTTVTTTVTTRTSPIVKPVSTTIPTNVVKKRSAHLKRRKGKTARKTSHVKTTTFSRTSSGLSGGVAKTHRHHVHAHSSENSSSAQQTRSNKLNAFLKNPPKMKKTPYFNHPGLDVPSSPAL